MVEPSAMMRQMFDASAGKLVSYLPEKLENLKALKGSVSKMLDAMSEYSAGKIEWYNPRLCGRQTPSIKPGSGILVFDDDVPSGYTDEHGAGSLCVQRPVVKITENSGSLPYMDMYYMEPRSAMEGRIDAVEKLIIKMYPRSVRVLFDAMVPEIRSGGHLMATPKKTEDRGRYSVLSSKLAEGTEVSLTEMVDAFGPFSSEFRRVLEEFKTELRGEKSYTTFDLRDFSLIGVSDKTTMLDVLNKSIKSLKLEQRIEPVDYRVFSKG